LWKKAQYGGVMFSLKQLFKKQTTCWESITCSTKSRNKCPYYLNRDYYNCWEVEGTFCTNNEPETSAQKLIICSECDYYISNVWGLAPTSEHKANVRQALQSDISQMAKISVNDSINSALKELALLNDEISSRVVFNPDESNHHIYSDSTQLKELVNHLVSEAVEHLPPDGIITITSKDSAGKEIKVVLTSTSPSLHTAKPQSLPSCVHSFEFNTGYDDCYSWIVMVGKDRRQSSRRQGERRSNLSATSSKEQRENDRRAKDRRFQGAAA